jgi:hypothetical protein
MDVLIAKTAYEKFTDQKQTDTSSSSSSSSIVGWIVLVCIVLPLGVYAAYLSWGANTLVEWGPVPKSIFAFFAFIGGFSYLIGYWIQKYDLIQALKKYAPTAAAVAVASAPVVAAVGGGAFRRRR